MSYSSAHETSDLRTYAFKEGARELWRQGCAPPMPSSSGAARSFWPAPAENVPPRIAENLGCGSQTVRNAIHDFNERGLGALKAGSSRPKEVHAAFDAERDRVPTADPPPPAERASAKRVRFWTLAMAAEVSFEEGITERRVSGRDHPGDAGKAWGALGAGQDAGWRAPILSMPEKRGSRSADPAGPEPSGVGFGLRG